MDASSYGRMVERGGYATGGVVQSAGFTLVGEAGPELRFLRPSDEVLTPAEYFRRRREHPDDGTAGVPAKV